LSRTSLAYVDAGPDRAIVNTELVASDNDDDELLWSPLGQPFR